jgi:WD40 repeat protein
LRATDEAGAETGTRLDVERDTGTVLVPQIGGEVKSNGLNLREPASGLDLRIDTPGYPGAVAISPDQRLLVAAIDRALWLWALPDGAALAGPIELETEAQMLRYDRGGAWLVAGLADGRIQPLDPRTARPTRAPLGAHLSTAIIGVRVMAASPDGRTLASGGPDGRIILWDTGTWEQRTVLWAHGAAVLSGPIFEGAVAVNVLAFSPDGGSLASDTVGGVAVWFRANGEWIRRKLEVPWGVEDVAFAADGRALVTAGHAGRLRWDLAPSSWQHKACEIAGRNLTAQEWRQYLTYSSEGAATWLRRFDPRYRATCPPSMR